MAKSKIRRAGLIVLLSIGLLQLVGAEPLTDTLKGLTGGLFDNLGKTLEGRMGSGGGSSGNGLAGLDLGGLLNQQQRSGANGADMSAIQEQIAQIYQMMQQQQQMGPRMFGRPGHMMQQPGMGGDFGGFGGHPMGRMMPPPFMHRPPFMHPPPFMRPPPFMQQQPFGQQFYQQGQQQQPDQQQQQQQQRPGMFDPLRDRYFQQFNNDSQQQQQPQPQSQQPETNNDDRNSSPAQMRLQS